MDRIEDLLAKRFIARPDVKAVQQTNGAYHPHVDHQHGRDVECPGTCPRVGFKRADLTAHIEGRRTYGHYLLSQDSKCKLFCYDLDLKETGVWLDDLDTWHDFNPREAWRDPDHPSRRWQTIQLRTLAEALASRARVKLGIGVALLSSGNKGLHVYGFMEQAEPAADVRAAAIFVLEDFKVFERVKGDHFWEHKSQDPHTGFPNIQIEVFPKQDSLDGKDLGNLLRLPLGINQKSKQESFFLDMRCGYDQLKPLDAIEALTRMNPWAGSNA